MAGMVPTHATTPTVRLFPTTPTKPRRTSRFFYHYNKMRPEWGPLDTMLVHFRGRIIPAPQGITCLAICESTNRPEQPRIVMQGWASKCVTDSRGHVFIVP
jgi:hypothetical protein